MEVFTDFVKLCYIVTWANLDISDCIEFTPQAAHMFNSTGNMFQVEICFENSDLIQAEYYLLDIHLQSKQWNHQLNVKFLSIYVMPGGGIWIWFGGGYYSTLKTPIHF